MPKNRRPPTGAAPRGLPAAFDEMRFGASRTLNLRDGLPTAEQAAARCEAWLRERQLARAGEVLVITGRGNASPDGRPVVKEAVAKLLGSLRRRGVVTAVHEHTPGSFVVRLAPVSKLFEAPRSRRHPAPLPIPDPRALQGLDRETRRLLKELAERTLDALGVSAPTRALVEREMEKRFAELAQSVAPGPDREARLRSAIRVALDEVE